MNRITVLYYAKVLGFIAEESTSKGGFKLLYAPAFSESAEDGKQGAALKNFMQETSKGIRLFPPAVYPQTAFFFLHLKLLFESLDLRESLFWFGFFSWERLQSPS